MWLLESTAAWVAYKVTKANGKTPAWESSIARPGEGRSYHDFPPLYAVLDEQLNRFHSTLSTPGSFSTPPRSMPVDGIVKAIWQRGGGGRKARRGIARWTT